MNDPRADSRVSAPECNHREGRAYVHYRPGRPGALLDSADR